MAAATIVGPSTATAGVPGGNTAAYNLVTTAQVLKGGPGILMRLLVTTPGSAGNLTFNDCATVGAAAAANQIVSIPFGSLTIGQMITFEWPCIAGIVVSALPTGGLYSVSFS
jgi:hypothetical protein